MLAAAVAEKNKTHFTQGTLFPSQSFKRQLSDSMQKDLR
jgi:hypothetical protein